MKSFITEFRTDLSADNTTFDTASVDGGQNSQVLSQAGVEAVSAASNSSLSMVNGP